MAFNAHFSSLVVLVIKSISKIALNSNWTMPDILIATFSSKCASVFEYPIHNLLLALRIIY